jgi:hypothetical protein
MQTTTATTDHRSKNADLFFRAKASIEAIKELQRTYNRECARRIGELARIESLAYTEYRSTSPSLLDVEPSLSPEGAGLLSSPTRGLTCGSSLL